MLVHQEIFHQLVAAAVGDGILQCIHHQKLLVKLSVLLRGCFIIIRDGSTELLGGFLRAAERILVVLALKTFELLTDAGGTEVIFARGFRHQAAECIRILLHDDGFQYRGYLWIVTGRTLHKKPRKKLAHRCGQQMPHDDRQIGDDDQNCPRLRIAIELRVGLRLLLDVGDAGRIQLKALRSECGIVDLSDRLLRFLEGALEVDDRNAVVRICIHSACEDRREKCLAAAIRVIGRRRHICYGQMQTILLFHARNYDGAQNREECGVIPEGISRAVLKNFVRCRTCQLKIRHNLTKHLNSPLLFLVRKAPAELLSGRFGNQQPPSALTTEASRDSSRQSGSCANGVSMSAARSGVPLKVTLPALY